jgi:hypothetical protein
MNLRAVLLRPERRGRRRPARGLIRDLHSGFAAGRDVAELLPHDSKLVTHTAHEPLRAKRARVHRGCSTSNSRFKVVTTGRVWVVLVSVQPSA